MANSNDIIEGFRDAVRTQDTHKRLRLAVDLSSALQNLSLEVVGSPADQLIDGLLPWISSSNFKVSCQGLELMGLMALRMGTDFKPNIISALPSIIDRLGDSKQIVRDQAIDTIFKFMDPVSSPQYVFDILTNSINHKNWRVREVLMIVLTKTINAFGASSIQLSKLTPHLIKLISDPTGQVRDTAVLTMVEIYRHVGERFRNDLLKRNVPDAKLTSILSKFDQTQKSGNMVQTSQVDGAVLSTTVEKKKSSKNVRRSTSFSAGDKKKNHMPAERVISASGAVDETDFMTAWEEVPDPKVYSTREVSAELDRINGVLSNTNNDWEKRVDALQQLRTYTKVSPQVDNFNKLAKDLENALRLSEKGTSQDAAVKNQVKDLRSSVVKEACLTLSYMSSMMENRFDYLAEAMLPSLITLIPNSAKIMSTSGHAALRLIIKHTASPRLIPIIISNLLTSKSKDIRRKSAEYMGLLLEVWDTSVLKSHLEFLKETIRTLRLSAGKRHNFKTLTSKFSHVALLEEAIRKGIADADSEARAAVRRAYWLFADHYKSRADKKKCYRKTLTSKFSMMQKFDASKQKLLQSDKNLLTAGVTQQPKKVYGRVTNSSKPVRSMSESSNSKKKTSRNGVMGPPQAPPMQRSASQLEYKRVAPHMTPRQKSCDDLKRNAVRPATVREGRSRYTSQRSTTSQPSSRTGSPKRPIPAMPTMTRERSEDYMKTYSLSRTRIPTPSKSSSRPASRSSSRQTSRDPSPVRSQMPGAYETRMRNGTSNGVTEDAIWDALKRKGPRQRTTSQSSVNGQGSDESDTSSLYSHDSGGKKNILQNSSRRDFVSKYCNMYGVPQEKGYI